MSLKNKTFMNKKYIKKCIFEINDVKHSKMMELLKCDKFYNLYDYRSLSTKLIKLKCA